MACAPNSILLKVKVASRTVLCVCDKVSNIHVSQDSEAASPGAWRLWSATEAVPGGSPLGIVVGYCGQSHTRMLSVPQRLCEQLLTLGKSPESSISTLPSPELDAIQTLSTSLDCS